MTMTSVPVLLPPNPNRFMAFLKLRAGAACPAGMDVLNRFSTRLVSVNVAAADLPDLRRHPDVEEVAFSRPLPG